MKSGPKPLTPALRLLRGSRTRPRHNNNPLPVPKRGTGEPRLEEVPSWSERRDMAEVLSPEARRIWQQVIRPLDLPIWQWVPAVQYCTCLARWQKNIQVLQEESDVLTSEITGGKYGHPLVKIVKDLAKELGELRHVLGLNGSGHEVETTKTGRERSGTATGKTAKRKERFFA